ALDTVPTSVELDVLRCDFQLFRREIHALADHFARGVDHGTTMRHHGARGDGAVAGELRAIRIARPQDDLLRVHPERCGDNVRKHRLVPLPRRPGERVDRSVSRVTELERYFLLRRRAATRGFDEDRAAYSAQLALALGHSTSLIKRLP